MDGEEPGERLSHWKTNGVMGCICRPIRYLIKLIKLVKAFIHRGALPAGAGYADEQSFVLPNGVSGNYYLLLVTDEADVIYDADTTNNYGMVRQTGGSNNDPVPIGD